MSSLRLMLQGKTLKKAVEANDVEDIKAKIEALTQAFYPPIENLSGSSAGPGKCCRIW